MPGAPDAISILPLLFAFADCNDVANYLVTGDDWEGIAKDTTLDPSIRMADAYGKDLDQDLAWLGFLERNIF